MTQTERQREYGRAWRARNPGAHRAKVLKYTYGLPPARHDEILAAQGGVCAICQRPEPRERYALSVDHDHLCCSGKKSCGECIRGLLCGNCNSVLGLVKDDIDTLYAAIAYLESR